MNSIVAHLGPTVRDARNEKGWSQEHLADLARLDRSYVGEIERGLVSPSLTTLVKLAAALQVAPSELISNCERRVTAFSPPNSRKGVVCGPSPTPSEQGSSV